MKNHFTFLIALLLTLSVFAQDPRLVDSLEAALEAHNTHKLEMKISSPSMYDTTAANILNQLAKAYISSDPVKAMEYCNQFLDISQKINFKKGIGDAYNRMGLIKSATGDYLPALEFYKKSLTIRQEIGDKKAIANCYGNFGNIYHDLSNYPEALKNHFASLKIFEEIGDRKSIAYCYNNIGSIYRDNGNNPEALKNYFASLKITKELGDKNGLAHCYINIGLGYADQNKYSEALINYFDGFKIFEEMGEKRGMALANNNIGMVYYKQGNYAEALKHQFSALEIFEKIGDKKGMAGACGNIGNIYTKQKKFNEAFKFLNKALSLAKEIGSLDFIRESHRSISNLENGRGNYNKALEHFKLYITYSDSIVNTESTRKTVALQMNYDFNKKQDSLAVVQASKDVLTVKEIQKQKLVRNTFIGGTILFLLLAGAIFMGLRKTGKAKKKSEELLLNILPAEVAEEIKATGTAKAKAYTLVTVMFTDFKDFTSVSEKVSAELLVDEIHTCFSAFDNIIQKHNIEKIKTIGDAYLCASGLPVSNYTHATDMLNAAFEIRDFMLNRKSEKEQRGEIPFELRIGIHTGPVVAGVVGVKKYAYDIWGDTVNLAARMEQNSDAGKVNISGATYDLVKDKFSCTHRGKIQAKNKGEIDMYFVERVG